LPETNPMFDTQAALERLGQKRAVYRRILLRFAEEHRHRAREFESAVARGNMTEAGKILHSLKGLTGNLGMRCLFNAIVSLQAHVNAGQVLPDEIREFRDAFAETMRALDEIPCPDDKTDQFVSEYDLKALTPLLNTLSVHLREGSPRATDILSGLRDALGGVNPEVMRTLESCIESFNFETAESTLESLLKMVHNTPTETTRT